MLMSIPKTNILSMDPMPPITTALALLQKIERQKQIKDAADLLDEANAYVVKSEIKNPAPDFKKATVETSNVAGFSECGNTNHST